MASVVTSYTGLFDPADGRPHIDRIQIPPIQRDYAQGRLDPTTTAIREAFLDVLCGAVTGADAVGLDFVYGEVDEGVFSPLDGQQRLTTLFLLHWYLASRTGRLTGEDPWTSFSYATRPSARLFCARLADVKLPPDAAPPSEWLTDQHWYLYVWDRDPTIRAMLVVIDSIHERLASADLDAAWARLVDPDGPVITFDFLPVEDMGSHDDLYIKMNSRGKPLTQFENFKARMQQALDGSPRTGEFAHKIDGTWSDLLWPRHGGDNTVDDELLNYITYVIEVCEWRRGDTTARRQPLITRAELAFTRAPTAAEDLHFLFHAFDTWVDEDIDACFDRWFSTSSATNEEGDSKILIFGTEATPNLFDACIRDYGNEQRFGIQRRLLLHAVLIHRIHLTEDFLGRLRTVRNLLAASQDELRPEAMAQIVADVEHIIVHGDLDGIVGLNQAQRGDEIEKRAFVLEHPGQRTHVHSLEDHDLLRGSLVAIDLDVDGFATRADAFDRLFSDPDLRPLLTGALLAAGQYQRYIGISMRFGAPQLSSRWRDLLTGADRDKLASTRAVLRAVLDALGSADEPADRLRAIQEDWLRRQLEVQRFDWRYYLVRYPAMRIGKSGIYRSPDGTMGYSLCMLQGEYLNGYYRDPYLQAIVHTVEPEGAIVGTNNGGPWFIGLATNERWLELERSGLRLRCVQQGFEIAPPPVEQHQAAFDSLVASRSDVQDMGDRYLLVVPQVDLDGELVDTIDRVESAAGLVRNLLDAGC